MPSFLSDRDKAILQQLITWWKNVRVNTPKDGRAVHKFQSPDIYVALPPSGGIPALTLAGSSPAAGDTPGSATCDIYRLNSSGDLEAITGLDKTVYNVSTSSVPEQWIIVERSKQGKWVVPVDTGGGPASYKVTTFPLWDNTEKELFVRAIATPSSEDSDSQILETENTKNGVVSGDVLIYLTGVAVNDRRGSLMSGSIHPGLRVWAISANNRLEMVSFPTPENQWVIADVNAFTLPAYSVVEPGGGTGAYMDSSVRPMFIAPVEYNPPGIKYDGKLSGLPLLLGYWGSDTASGTSTDEFGTETIGTHAISQYAWARINQDTLRSGRTGPNRGDMYGPIPSSLELYPGIPGFVIPSLATEDQLLPDGGLICPVLSASIGQIAYAVVRTSWTEAGSTSDSPYAICHPLYSVGIGSSSTQIAYNGSDATPDGGGTMPDVRILVRLPRNGTGRDPNIRVDNTISYRRGGTVFDSDQGNSIELPAHGMSEMMIVGDYLDDKIGTIKFWNLSTGAIPQGWKQIASSNLKFVRCANTYALTGSTFGTTGTDHTSIDMIAIERFR